MLRVAVGRMTVLWADSPTRGSPPTILRSPDARGRPPPCRGLRVSWDEDVESPRPSRAKMHLVARSLCAEEHDETY